MNYRVTLSQGLDDTRTILINATSPETAHKEIYFYERNDEEEITEILDENDEIVYDCAGFRN